MPFTQGNFTRYLNQWQPPNTKSSLKITDLKCHSNLTKAKELMTSCVTYSTGVHITVDCHSFDPHTLTRVDHTAGDFSPICNQHLVKLLKNKRFWMMSQSHSIILCIYTRNRKGYLAPKKYFAWIHSDRFGRVTRSRIDWLCNFSLFAHSNSKGHMKLSIFCFFT